MSRIVPAMFLQTMQRLIEFRPTTADNEFLRLVHYKDLATELKRNMKTLFISFFRDESGATAIEYGMIAALIAAVIIGTLQTIGTQLNAKFTSISGQLN